MMSARVPTRDAELFCRIECVVGEGPFWHQGRLFWVDILGSRLHSCDEKGADLHSIDFPSHLGAAAPWGAGFIAGTKDGLGVMISHGAFKLLPASPPMATGMRFNDGKLDPSGRFWCGSNAYTFTPGMGSLYRVERNGAIKCLVTGLILPNGLDWDEDAGLFYFVDTFTQRVDKFDYDAASGDIENRRLAFHIPKEYGIPDGMSLDPQGRLWVACWGGSRVVAFEPKTGRTLCTIRVPTQLSSSCAVGPDGRSLYITTARSVLSPEALANEPLAGSVFRAELPQ
jgi:sugar lactone lactonase YvrE